MLMSIHLYVYAEITESQNGGGWEGPLWVIIPWEGMPWHGGAHQHDDMGLGGQPLQQVMASSCPTSPALWSRPSRTCLGPCTLGMRGVRAPGLASSSLAACLQPPQVHPSLPSCSGCSKMATQGFLLCP